MSARVLFVGLDAMEASLVERWMEEGRLPTLSALSLRGGAIPLDNSVELLSGSVWSELATGRSVGTTGRYFHVRQLVSGETAPRALRTEDVDPTSFWSMASDAGGRVAAIDIPQSVLAPDVNGVQLVEHSVHERGYGTASDPPRLLEEIIGRHGAYPVYSCEDHDRSLGGYSDLRERLLAAVDYKADLLVDLLSREDWDLFACAFSEVHCVGHQFWEYHAGEALRDGTPAPDELRDAMRDVYAATDSALRRVLDAAGADASAVIVASHGMGFMPRGPQLLPEVLVRLGLGSGRGAAAQARSRLPIGVRELLRRIVPRGVRTGVQRAAGSLPQPLDSPSTRAVALPTSRAGAIRLNLRGRDPHGCIAPGEEAQALLHEIRDALTELTDPQSDERIVARAVTSHEAFGPAPHPDLPDLMVAFRSDIGPITTCRSPRVGTITPGVSSGHMDWRGGDHTPLSRLWHSGPSIGALVGEGARAIDVAPTVLDLLGVDAPASLDGRSLLRLGLSEARS